MKTDDFEEYQKKIRKELEEREQKQSEFYRKLGKEAEEIRKKDYETKERIRIEEVSKSGKSLLVYAIEKLLEKSILYKNKNIEVSFYELGFGNYRDGRHFLNILKENNCISDVCHSTNESSVVESVNYKKLNKYKDDLKKLSEDELEEKEKKKISIKKIVLDEKNYQLIINKGEELVSFKRKERAKVNPEDEDLSPKQKSELEKEAHKTKAFKIIQSLWEFRWEIKNDRVVKKGDVVSMDNLWKISSCDSLGALAKQITRLNSRFKNQGIPIKIVKKNGSCKMEI